MRRRLGFVRLALALMLGAATAAAIAQTPAGPSLTLLSKEGRRPLPLVTVGNQDYVPVDEIATAFGGSVQEDRLAGGLTMSVSGRTIVLTPDQGVVSVAGRLVSLSAPVIRQGNRWLVPADFLSRAIALATSTRMDLRRPSRLVVVGDLRVPRVTARVEGAGGRTSVVFDISPAAAARVVAPVTGQLDVEFDADALDLALPTVAPQELLRGITPGESATSVRVTTGPRFGIYRASTEQAGGDTSRLTVELLPAGTETSETTPAPAPELPPVVMPAPMGLRTVVLDPGHGGDETGAQGPRRTLEKDVTLAIARRLKGLIESRLGLQVFLTREDDRLMSLDERTAFANNQQADAFISIHANSSVSAAMKGAEVYFLSLSGVQPAQPPEPLAAPDVAPTVLPTLSGGMRAIDLVLWERAQEQHIDKSSALAGFVDQALRTRVEMSPRGVQQAPLRVLVGANMPAVLVETGYLSHPQQEGALSSTEGQTHVAEALFDALLRFREQIDRAAAVPATP